MWVLHFGISILSFRSGFGHYGTAILTYVSAVHGGYILFELCIDSVYLSPSHYGATPSRLQGREDVDCAWKMILERYDGWEEYGVPMAGWLYGCGKCMTNNPACGSWVGFSLPHSTLDALHGRDDIIYHAYVRPADVSIPRHRPNCIVEHLSTMYGLFNSICWSSFVLSCWKTVNESFMSSWDQPYSDERTCVYRVLQQT